MRKSTRFCLFAATAAAINFMLPSVKAAVVYDNVSNAENNPVNTGGTDNGNDFAVLGSLYTSKTSKGKTTYTAAYDNAGGGLFALAAGTTDITGFDLYPTIFDTTSGGALQTGAAYNYSGLKFTIDVWGTVNLGTVNASNPAFSNLLGTYTITDFEGTGAFDNGEIYFYESATPGVLPGISLTTPLVLPSSVEDDTAGEPVIGLSYVVDATQGTNAATATYTAVDGVSPSYTYGSPATVGDDSDPGSSTFNSDFYFNETNEQTGNFSEGPFNFTGLSDSDLAARVYGDVAAVPEPASIALLGLSAVALLGRRKRLV